MRECQRKFCFEVFLRAGFWAGFQSLHLKKKISWLDIIFCGFFIVNKICFLLWLKFIEFRENKLVSTALKSRIQKQNLSDVLCVRLIRKIYWYTFFTVCHAMPSITAYTCQYIYVKTSRKKSRRGEIYR